MRCGHGDGEQAQGVIEVVLYRRLVNLQHGGLHPRFECMRPERAEGYRQSRADASCQQEHFHFLLPP